jgi:outer membrane protein assembly factor BamD
MLSIKFRVQLFFTLFIIFGISSCSSPNISEDSNLAAKQLYVLAKEALNDGHYDKAIEYYEVLEARFPFGAYAEQAQFDSIYAYYKSEEPELAILMAERFIKNNPRHPNVDYAYYIKGLANFELNASFFGRFLPLDHSQRDSAATEQAFQSFLELLSRFPKSKYAEDARQRMLFLRNKLAQREINVAEYYIKRGAYVAAGNRAKYVLEKYPRTPSVPDALVILAKSYKVMNLQDLLADTVKVLQLNFPDHAGITEIEELHLEN